MCGCGWRPGGGRCRWPQVSAGGAGLLSSLTGSDAFAELPEAATGVAPGERITILPFAGLF
ncbi:hypothetical protein ACFFMP_04000 [Pseudoroseomonas cervicalis]|uniref:hypothetical protein n=1 Tax=Teichococcus cervicalis TaxID=204525 RepID=UPI0035E55110